jgi:hypothetical protein
MGNYLFAYRGGSTPESPEAGKAVMDAWIAWFGELGEAVVDGGAPFGASSTVAVGGTASDGAPSGLTGYSVIAADTLADAANLAGGCPIFDAGGTVDVYEAMAM